MPTNALVPYLAVHDGAAALAWYVDALGAVETMRFPMDDGRVGHAELRIGGAVLYLADEYPEIGHVSPRTLGGASSSLHLTVDDVDAVFARAIAGGATSLREPADQPHGSRQGGLVDPFGHRWILSQPLVQLTAPHIDRDDPRCAGLECTVGEAAGRSAGIEDRCADQVDPEPVECSSQLFPASSHEARGRTRDDDRFVGGDHP